MDRSADTADFDPWIATKRLLREARSGALATLMTGSKDPYCSLVNVATAATGQPILLLSRLAIHTQNIQADSRISLMLDERRGGDPLEDARVMLMGTIARTSDPHERRRYLARQPGAELFVGFADFAFYRMEVRATHLVAGFGRIVDLAARDILIDVSAAEPLLEAEPEIVTHMNNDHADAVRLYATVLLGAPEGPWQCVGCDPEGLDLQLGRSARHLFLPARVTTPAELSKVLRQMAEDARRKPASKAPPGNITPV